MSVVTDFGFNTAYIRDGKLPPIPPEFPSDKFPKFTPSDLWKKYCHIFCTTTVFRDNIDVMVEEYNRLGELPSISLVSNEKIWGNICWCTACNKYRKKGNPACVNHRTSPA